MSQRSPARKVFTIVTALALAGATLVLTAGVFIMSGTKANMTFTKISTTPVVGKAKTTTTTSTTTTTTTPTTPTTPTAQP
jgi:hypothetical protein